MCVIVVFTRQSCLMMCSPQYLVHLSGVKQIDWIEFQHNAVVWQRSKRIQRREIGSAHKKTNYLEYLITIPQMKLVKISYSLADSRTMEPRTWSFSLVWLINWPLSVSQRSAIESYSIKLWVNTYKIVTISTTVIYIEDDWEFCWTVCRWRAIARAQTWIIAIFLCILRIYM